MDPEVARTLEACTITSKERPNQLTPQLVQDCDAARKALRERPNPQEFGLGFSTKSNVESTFLSGAFCENVALFCI